MKKNRILRRSKPRNAIITTIYVRKNQLIKLEFRLNFFQVPSHWARIGRIGIYLRHPTRRQELHKIHQIIGLDLLPHLVYQLLHFGIGYHGILCQSKEQAHWQVWALFLLLNKIS
jgi:hypothetical protein